MSLLFSKDRIKTALIATVLTIAVWAFSSAFQEVLYPLLKGVKWSQAGAKLFIGLGRMFAIYFVKNAIIAAAIGGLPLFFIFLGIARGKGLPSPVKNLITAVLLISVLMTLLVGASHFTSLISFKYANSYVKALIAITLGVFAGLFTLNRQQKKAIS